MSESRDLPSPDAEPERYENRPLLLFFENWVLDCIGVLDTEQQDQMQAAVEEVLNADGPWPVTLREGFELEESIENEFRELWKSLQADAKEQGSSITPVQFAKLVVEENFPELLEEHEEEE